MFPRKLLSFLERCYQLWESHRTSHECHSKSPFHHYALLLLSLFRTPHYTSCHTSNVYLCCQRQSERAILNVIHPAQYFSSSISNFLCLAASAFSSHSTEGISWGDFRAVLYHSKYDSIHLQPESSQQRSTRLCNQHRKPKALL